jgi:hypothetical protein
VAGLVVERLVDIVQQHRKQQNLGVGLGIGGHDGTRVVRDTLDMIHAVRDRLPLGVHQHANVVCDRLAGR